MSAHIEKPTQCGHCTAWTDYPDLERVEHSLGASLVCPVCGYNWFAVPPADYDGGLLYEQ